MDGSVSYVSDTCAVYSIISQTVTNNNWTSHLQNKMNQQKSLYLKLKKASKLHLL
jgi:hypothetical protein